MISPAAFSLFKSAVNTMVGAAYQETPTLYQKIATVVPSGNAQTVFGWTGMLPKPRLWTGPRVVHEAAPQTYTLVNQIYEETVGINRVDLDDDQFGIYYRLLPDLARQLKRQKDYWLRDLIEASGDQASTAIQAGYDGLSFWNTAHPVDIYNAGAGTYVNDFTGGGASVTMNGTPITIGGALSLTSLATMREYMSTLKAEDGEPMGLTADTIMFPSMLEMEVTTLLTAMFLAPPSYGTFTGQVGAVDNPGRRFGLEMLKNELLVDPRKFYMLCTSKAVKPFVWSEREAVQMVPRTNPSDPIVFDENKFLWGGWGRGAPGWAFSWLAFRSGP
jgi:phage major head subunit gpT-like protein